MLPSAASLARRIICCASQRHLLTVARCGCAAFGLSPKQFLPPSDSRTCRFRAHQVHSVSECGKSIQVHKSRLQSRKDVHTMEAILSAAYDSYDGIVIDAAELPADPAQFHMLLQRSLQVRLPSCERPLWSAGFRVGRYRPAACRANNRLRGCLQTWREQKKRGIWLKVPVQKASLINIAVDAGFSFHHAEPDYLMLTHWLPATESTLPPNASHQV